MEGLANLLKKGVPIICVVVLGYAGEKGVDGGFIKDVWMAAKTASPFAAMLAIMAWLDEKRERREAQKQCNERTMDFVKTVNGMSVTFERALAKMQRSRRR